jgi:hypothetical protein
LNFAQGDNLMEMFSGYNSDTLSGGRVAAEIRRGSDAGEFRLLPELALSQTSETGKGLAHNLDFYGRYGSWRFLGGNLQREKTFISLAPAVTEFGVLRKKTNAQFGYESASFNTYADYLTQSGEYGQETSYKAQGYFSQIKNLSLFSIANLRIADSDSLKRDYRELNFGGNYSLSDIILRRLRFRRLDLYGEAKTSVTDCEYPLGPDSANTKTNSNSIYLQGNISPGKNIHLTPECRLIDKTQSQNGEKPSPLSRDTMLRGTGNALDLIPGIRHYYHWNLEYNQDKFAFGNRDVYLYREGYLSNEFLPARWWDKLSVFNFGVTFYRSDKDSLLAVDEDFFDLWNIEEDYSFFSASNIYRVTYYPADEWEITEIITSSEGTASQRFQSQSTGWWRQEDSQICSRFYYTKDSDGINNSITYNPIIDWYRRWDKGFLTRFSLAVSFQDAETEDEYTVMPTVYVDKYLDIQIKNSYLQIRNTLQPEYRRSTGADNLDEFSLTEALNLDLNLYHKIIFRLIASADYTYDLETEAEETDFEIETRATIKF